MATFDNTEIAFRYKTNRDLRRSWLLFSLLFYSFLVRLSNGALKLALSLHLPVGWIIKPTVYRQFVGGVSITDCIPAVRMLERYGVRAVLDYSVEGGHDEEVIRQTLEETLRTIDNAAKDPNIPFAVFKPTALGNLEVMDMEVYTSRVDTLCKHAFECQVPIMIDAEDSWYQDKVDAVVTSMMEKYNRQKAVVFNTLQMYRRDRLEFLRSSVGKAKENGYFYGVKFVRGAYMENERARAAAMNYPSPIHDDKAGTDKAFNDALRFSMDNLDIVTIFCGTHNEESCELLTKLMAEKSVPRNDPRVWFSQLYGMSDHITFNLASEGYLVAKYLPYGPVRHVMPYLFRRAEENTSIAGQTGRELRLIRQERVRRKSIH